MKITKFIDRHDMIAASESVFGLKEKQAVQGRKQTVRPATRAEIQKAIDDYLRNGGKITEYKTEDLHDYRGFIEAEFNSGNNM